MMHNLERIQVLGPLCTSCAEVLRTICDNESSLSQEFAFLGTIMSFSLGFAACGWLEEDLG